MKICDLHTHSDYSDGSFTPEEVAAEAVARGVSAVVLTDHNTLRGVDEFMCACGRAGVECASGVETTTDWRGREIHLVALFAESGRFSEIDELLGVLAKEKRRQNIELVNALCRDGYIISYGEIERANPKGNINRAHIANALLEHGYVSSIDEAFSGVLSEEAGYYTPPTRPDTIEMIKMIDEACAVSVVAHPYITLSDTELEEFLCEACPAGLDGMETRYTKYDAQTEKKASDTAHSFGILESGGSDFHGSVKPGTVLGHGYGSLCVPYEFFAALKARAEQKIKKFTF